MSQLNVLIVGASIAGPTAAYWFAKAGARVTVIERFPELRTSGQYIDVRSVGVSVMRKMPGMEEAVRAKRPVLEGLSFVRSDGRPYGVIRASGNPDQQTLVSEYEILRGDLSRIIYDLSKQFGTVKYVFGEQVASIQYNDGEDGPATVEFSGSLPTSQYDLVVACDGLTSRTRAIALGGGVRDHMKPINTWAAFFSIEKDLINGSKVGLSYSAPGGRFIGAGVHPAGGNIIGFMGINRRDDDQSMVPFREAQKEGTDATKKFVYEHFQGIGWKTDDILAEMMTTKEFYTSEFAQVKTPTLHKGRVVLVGDAGYAPGPTGAGTTLALAGAYYLAGEINKHNGDLQAGLEGYSQQMKPLITELQKIPPLIPGIMAPQSAWGLWLRNQLFRFICWARLLEFAQKLLGGVLENNNKYPLSEYEWAA